MNDKMKYTAKNLVIPTTSLDEINHNRKVNNYIHNTPWKKLLAYFLDRANSLDMDTLIMGVDNINPRRLKGLLKKYEDKGYKPDARTDKMRTGMVIIMLHSRIKERESMERHSKAMNNYMDEVESAKNFSEQ